MSELKPCDHCNGEYDPQMGATVHHHNCPNLHFPSSPAAPADLVEKLLDVFRSAPLHGDAGCDKLCDDEWRTIATAAIAAMQLVVEALEGVNARLRRVIERDATRFDYCASMIERGFNISGTLRAEHSAKAQAFALETRAALAGAKP